MNPSTKTLDYYFSVISPWTYMGDQRFRALAEKYGYMMMGSNNSENGITQAQLGVREDLTSISIQCHVLAGTEKSHGHRGVSGTCHDQRGSGEAGPLLQFAVLCGRWVGRQQGG